MQTTERPTAARPRGAVALAGAVLAVSGLLVALLVAGGVDVPQAGRLALVVAVQLVTGALVWRLARGPVPSATTEVLGAGLALGTLMSLLGAQLLRPTGLGGVGWLLPTVLLLASTAVPAVRRRLGAGEVRPPRADEAAAVLGGIAVGLVSVWSHWRAHPLEWTGWWRYYVDIPHHEALSRSLATWGPGDDILQVGEPIRYHWFSHAWTGAVTDAASAGSFVVLTRVLPLVALVGTVALVWAWASRLSARRSVPPLAVLLTVLALDVGDERKVGFLDLFAISPSLGMGALWFLTAALVLTEHLRRRLAAGPLLLALLAVGCMGGKTSYAAVLAGGAGLVALLSLGRPLLRARAWAAAVVVAVALAAAFVALILGSTGNLRVEPGAVADVLGVLPDGTGAAVAAGILAAVLALAAPWAGLLPLLADRRTAFRPEVRFALGAAVAGLLLATVLGHPGASQLYFPISAGLVAGVVSAWGLVRALDSLPRGWRAAAVLAGAAAGVVGLGGVPGAPAWTTPYAVWLPPVLFALAALPGRSDPARGRPARFASVLACGVVAAAVLTGVVTTVQTARAPAPEVPAADAAGAWTPSHEAALVWLRENSRQDDVVVTNRQCIRPTPAGVDCLRYRWFLTAALGHRRTYVEGADYVAGQPPPAPVLERVERSRRFVEAPTAADARVLWDAGVRWVVVDLASTATREWTPFAESAFATPTTEVLRLARP